MIRRWTIPGRPAGRALILFEMTAPRVMHVVVGGEIGGAERIVVALAQRPELTSADHQVALITPNRALVEFLASAGLRVHHRGAARESPLAYLVTSLGPSDVGWLETLLARERIDVVHTHTFGSHVLGARAARRAGLGSVRTEHDFKHYFDPSCTLFTRWAGARTDRLVAVSQYVLKVLSRAAPRTAARMTVVRNGLDSSYWAPVPALPRARPFRAAMVCRLVARKRVDVAIEAAARAGIDLIVVGDGEERARLTRVARRRGAAVTFAGHCSDPRPLVAECDVVLSTAENEPLGLSLLEALSMERPVIAGASGGVPEIVRDGVTGWLVAEPTAAAFAEALARARQNRPSLRAMGAEARRFVVAECGMDRMCQGYAEVYRSVLEKP